MFFLGRCYQTGIGPLPADATIAEQWFRKAADAVRGIRLARIGADLSECAGLRITLTKNPESG
jgi:hypothetical protein